MKKQNTSAATSLMLDNIIVGDYHAVNEIFSDIISKKCNNKINELKIDLSQTLFEAFGRRTFVRPGLRPGRSPVTVHDVKPESAVTPKPAVPPKPAEQSTLSAEKNMDARDRQLVGAKTVEPSAAAVRPIGTPGGRKGSASKSRESEASTTTKTTTGPTDLGPSPITRETQFGQPAQTTGGGTQVAKLLQPRLSRDTTGSGVGLRDTSAPEASAGRDRNAAQKRWFDTPDSKGPSFSQQSDYVPGVRKTPTYRNNFTSEPIGTVPARQVGLRALETPKYGPEKLSEPISSTSKPDGTSRQILPRAKVSDIENITKANREAEIRSRSLISNSQKAKEKFEQEKSSRSAWENEQERRAEERKSDTTAKKIAAAGVGALGIGAWLANRDGDKTPPAAPEAPEAPKAGAATLPPPPARPPTHPGSPETSVLNKPGSAKAPAAAPAAPAQAAPAQAAPAQAAPAQAAPAQAGSGAARNSYLAPVSSNGGASPRRPGDRNNDKNNDNIPALAPGKLVTNLPVVGIDLSPGTDTSASKQGSKSPRTTEFRWMNSIGNNRKEYSSYGGGTETKDDGTSDARDDGRSFKITIGSGAASPAVATTGSHPPAIGMNPNIAGTVRDLQNVYTDTFNKRQQARAENLAGTLGNLDASPKGTISKLPKNVQGVKFVTSGTSDNVRSGTGEYIEDDPEKTKFNDVRTNAAPPKKTNLASFLNSL